VSSDLDRTRAATVYGGPARSDYVESVSQPTEAGWCPPPPEETVTVQTSAIPTSREPALRGQTVVVPGRSR